MKRMLAIGLAVSGVGSTIRAEEILRRSVDRPSVLVPASDPVPLTAGYRQVPQAAAPIVRAASPETPPTPPPDLRRSPPRSTRSASDVLLVGHQQVEKLPAPTPVPAPKSSGVSGVLPSPRPTTAGGTAIYPSVIVIEPPQQGKTLPLEEAVHSVDGGHPLRTSFGSPELTVAPESILNLDPLFPNVQLSLYGSAEYLLWRTTEADMPILATTGPVLAFPNGAQKGGFLGDPGTTVLFGPGDAEIGTRSGGRFTLGLWLTPEKTCGIEARYFFLGREGYSFFADPNRFPVLTRPFFAINNLPPLGLPGQFGELVGMPGQFAGSLAVSGNNAFSGWDVNVVSGPCVPCGVCGPPPRFEWFVGYRTQKFDENITITENINVLANPEAFHALFPAGTNIVVSDRFETDTIFYGAQLGGRYQHYFGRLVVDLRGTIGIGVNRQNITINGNQTITRPGGVPPESFRGGLLAVASNIGSFSRETFSVVPEIGVNLGYQVTDTIRFFAGYTFLGWTNVLRAPEQIDTIVDVSQVPNNFLGAPAAGRNRPQIPFRESFFAAHGVNFGVEFRW